MSDECICGGSKDKPNPDCERCQLVAEIERLQKERDEAREVARGYFDPLASDAMIMIGRHPWLEEKDV